MADAYVFFFANRLIDRLFTKKHFFVILKRGISGENLNDFNTLLLVKVKIILKED